MSTIYLTGNFGYELYYARDLPANSVIDATGASWIVSNSANQNPDADTSYRDGSGQINVYPVIIYSAGDGLLLKGGTVWGEVPQDSDWVYTYNDSTAIRIDSAPGVIIDDWRIDKAWDGIRFRNDSANFLVDDTYLSNIRDDAIENDLGLSGTVRDSLFDGVFAGIGLSSSTDPDASANTITFDHVMMRSKSYLYEGEMTHGAFFKMNKDAPDHAPSLRLINSVFAIEDVTPIHISRLQLAWDNVIESHGNVFLNLSDTPLPAKYPKPPAGFTILQGQEARDYWQACKAAWLDNHDGTPVSDLTALPPLPNAGNDDVYFVKSINDIVNEAPNSGIDVVHSTIDYKLTANVENLILDGTANLRGAGNNLDNLIIGNSGRNLLNGCTGADTLRGWAGDDIYIVDDGGDAVQESSGGGVDTVRSSVNFIISNDIEKLVLTGSKNIDGAGNWIDNLIIGNAGSNELSGGAGDDRLVGKFGADVLAGGLGMDVLRGGVDSDPDRFVFDSIAESRPGAQRDRVCDFLSGIDKIDLRGIDADTNAGGNQVFEFSNSGPAANSIWVVDIGNHLMVRGDVNGDSVTDFAIQLNSINTVTISDFML